MTSLHRRKCFEQIEDLSVEEEIKYMDKLLPANPKNFQIWEHRMFFVKKTKDYEAELKAIQHTLELDAKNYHCWTYRKWLCDYFDLFDKEKQEVELYIDNDVMNNSAWVYRFYLYNRGEYRAIKDPGVIEKEIQYVMGKLSAEPANEAAWNYLNGYFDFLDPISQHLVPKSEHSAAPVAKLTYKAFPSVEKLVNVIISVDPNNSFAQRTKAAILFEKGDKEACAKIFDDLVQSDPIRNNYFKWLAKQARK